MNHDREALRRIMLDRRDSTSAERLELASESVRNQLRRWPPLPAASSVGAYWAINSEIHTSNIIDDILDAGQTLLLPAIQGDTMEFRVMRETRDLVPGHFGIREPRKRCTVDIPDVILVPTVAVTTEGYRLGYGHGYYDKYLKKHKIESVAMTLDKQVIKRIPTNPHDIPVDWVITESRLFHTSCASA